MSDWLIIIQSAGGLFTFAATWSTSSRRYAVAAAMSTSDRTGAHHHATVKCLV